MPCVILQSFLLCGERHGRLTIKIGGIRSIGSGVIGGGLFTVQTAERHRQLTKLYCLVTGQMGENNLIRVGIHSREQDSNSRPIDR